MSEFKKIYIDIYHGIFNEEILVYEDFIHLYELDIITQESVDSIVEQVKSLIFEHYNDGLYIRSEEFEDICYLNIILLFGEEYEFLLPYLEGINTDIPKDAIPEKQKNKEHDTFLWVSYTDQDEIIKTQEKLSELDIGSEVYYVESNSFERGAGDFHKNFLIGLITGFGEELGKRTVSSVLDKFESYQRAAVNSIDTKKLVSYISEQTNINQRDLQIKGVESLEDDDLIEVTIINRYKEITVKCTTDLKRIDYEIKDKTQTMI